MKYFHWQIQYLSLDICVAIKKNCLHWFFTGYIFFAVFFFLFCFALFSSVLLFCFFVLVFLFCFVFTVQCPLSPHLYQPYDCYWVLYQHCNLNLTQHQNYITVYQSITAVGHKSSGGSLVQAHAQSKVSSKVQSGLENLRAGGFSSLPAQAVPAYLSSQWHFLSLYLVQIFPHFNSWLL